MSSQAVYALVVRAATGAGFGPAGAVVIVSFMPKGKAPVLPDEDVESRSDQNTGMFFFLEFSRYFFLHFLNSIFKIIN